MNPQLRRSLLDFGPLLLFFIAYRLFDLFVATGTIMVTAVAAVVVGYVLDRKLHPLPLVTAIIVVIFGGLTLYLNDKMFIKIKPTMIYGLFAVVLLGGLWFKRPFIKTIFGTALELDEKSWRSLTIRFAGFFGGMAILNELIWRHFSEKAWVNFHVFGAVALTILFCVSQVPFLMKHQIEKENE